MTNHRTHTIQKFESTGQAVLSRHSDGMVIAIAVGQKVAWGEDPRNQQQRVFVDPVFALAFMRKVADADQQAVSGEETARAAIEETFGESKLVSPSLFKGVQ